MFNRDFLDLLIAIGGCHGRLKNYADKLASQKTVQTVEHWFDISNVDDALRIEEYIDAELVSGEAVSWCMELTFTTDRMIVEADVRRIHGDGYDVIESIADCEIQDLFEATNCVNEIARKICASDHL